MGIFSAIFQGPLNNSKVGHLFFFNLVNILFSLSKFRSAKNTCLTTRPVEDFWPWKLLSHTSKSLLWTFTRFAYFGYFLSNKFLKIDLSVQFKIFIWDIFCNRWKSEVRLEILYYTNWVPLQKSANSTCLKSWIRTFVGWLFNYFYWIIIF
jgi:hypothetical protein